MKDALSEALKEAQEKGFAESDPTLDVEGWDANFKLCIITVMHMVFFLNRKRSFIMALVQYQNLISVC